MEKGIEIEELKETEATLEELKIPKKLPNKFEKLIISV